MALSIKNATIFSGDYKKFKKIATIGNLLYKNSYKKAINLWRSLSGNEEVIGGMAEPDCIVSGCILILKKFFK